MLWAKAIHQLPQKRQILVEKSKKAVYEECNAIYQKGAIMHAFLNNF